MNGKAGQRIEANQYDILCIKEQVISSGIMDSTPLGISGSWSETLLRVIPPEE